MKSNQQRVRDSNSPVEPNIKLLNDWNTAIAKTKRDKMMRSWLETKPNQSI